MLTAEEIRENILTGHVRWAEKAVVAIYRLQTTDEQNSGETRHSNGVGFSGSDAEFGTSIARRIINGQSLTPKQEAVTRKMISKYSGQLAKLQK